MSDLSSSMKRHRFLKNALLICSGLIVLVACVWVVTRDRDSKAAVETADAGLILLGQGKRQEALEKLEMAEKLSKGVCAQRTYFYAEKQSTLKDSERRLWLRGVNALRGDRDSQDDYLQKQGTTEERITAKERRLEPWFETHQVPYSNDQTLIEIRLLHLYETAGNKAAAMKMLDRAVALYPWVDEVQSEASRIYKANKLHEKERELADLRLSDEELNVMNNCSDGSAKSGRHDLEVLMAKHPKILMPRLLRMYGDIAYNVVSEKATPQLHKDAEVVISMYPNLPEGYYARGLSRSDDDKEKVTDFTLALKLMPESSAILQHRVDAAEERGMRDLVLSDLDKLTALSSEREGFLPRKSNYLASIGEVKKAEEVLDLAIKKLGEGERFDSLMGRVSTVSLVNNGEPYGLAGLRQRKARMRAKQGDYKAAIAILDDLIKDNPKFLTNYDLSSDFRLQSGDPKGALELQKRAMELQGPPVQRSGAPSMFPSPPSMDVPTTLSSDMFVTEGAIDRIGRLSTIYDALHDTENAEKCRQNKLMLLKLNVIVDPSIFNVVELLKYADEVDNYRAGVWAVREVIKKDPSAIKHGTLEVYAYQLLDSKHPQYAFAVINELYRLSSDRQVLKDLREKALKRATAKPNAAVPNQAKASSARLSDVKPNAGKHDGAMLDVTKPTSAKTVGSASAN
jgi:tetratricopeptide (TPR) repeat protein